MLKFVSLLFLLAYSAGTQPMIRLKTCAGIKNVKQQSVRQVFRAEQSQIRKVARIHAESTHPTLKAMAAFSVQTGWPKLTTHACTMLPFIKFDTMQIRKFHTTEKLNETLIAKAEKAIRVLEQFDLQNHNTRFAETARSIIGYHKAACGNKDIFARRDFSEGYLKADTAWESYIGPLERVYLSPEDRDAINFITEMSDELFKLNASYQKERMS